MPYRNLTSDDLAREMGLRDVGGPNTGVEHRARAAGRRLMETGEVRDPYNLGTPSGGSGGGGFDEPTGGETLSRSEARSQARLAAPWLPDELLNAYVDAWVEHGNHELALNAIRQDSSYEQFFPGNLDAHGRVRMREGEYLEYVERARQVMRQNGLPEGFYDSRDDIARFVEGNVSLSELQSRIEEGFLAAQHAAPETRAELQEWYGVTEGELAAFFLDPDRSQQILMRKLTKAQIGGAAAQTGFGRLTQQEADRILTAGFGAEQARERLGSLRQQRELMTQLPGQRGGDISRDEQIGAAFEGDQTATDRLRRRTEGRQARFEGGGRAAAGQQGVTGMR